MGGFVRASLYGHESPDVNGYLIGHVGARVPAELRGQDGQLLAEARVPLLAVDVEHFSLSGTDETWIHRRTGD